VYLYPGKVAVVKPGAPHFGIVKRETERLDQVKASTGVGA